ncbi:DNA primase [Pleurocapsa sp. CCALA 161]|uniref:DNA primase n=1 Tax=Pleurocapsa sp. CCALA 161 TaxID=2107688 RepID=UPI000D059B8A|nr:DNA primase [Pleurocapsa sp. CCALA 161]PSB10375.1 DNA primase [Pleurocapsa sp. CCALA 161]
MIPRLHPDTIEEVQQRVDIVDVISEHIVLRKRGKDFLGLCPFHNEKTPSFSVSQDKQVYYCFGCGEGGNAYKFLMETGKQSFAEVVLDLARRYQVEIKTVEPEQRQEIQRQFTLKEQLYEILAIASSFFQHALYQSQGEVALTYLRQQRNIEENTIKRFQLGYAPLGWETLYRYLVEQKRYPVNLVEQAGLIKPRKTGSGYYDVFRDRLVIPIMDLQGRIIGFGSRSLKEEDQPKYLNSPETPLFDKSKTLFALDQARSAIGKADCAVVVEGYFDAIALHEAGINHVVASLGTAFTQEQLKQLLRFTASKQVILNFDADNAGKKATERAIAEIEDLVYGGVVQLRILNLPEGKDADEFIKSRADGVVLYHQALETAPLWLDWLIARLLADKNLKAADELQQVAAGMIKLLNKLQDANQRNHYLTHCAELLSQGDSRLVLQNLATLKSQIKSTRSSYQNNNLSQHKKSFSKPAFAIATDPESELLEQAEALLLRIYIHYPRYRDSIIEELETKDLLFNLASHRFLWQQIIMAEETIPNSSMSNINPLLSELHNLSASFPKAMMAVTKLFHLDEKTQEDVFRTQVRVAEAIASLEQVNYQRRQIYCSEQLQNLNPATDIKLMEYYCQEIQTAVAKIRELEQIRLNYAQDPIIQ